MQNGEVKNFTHILKFLIIVFYIADADKMVDHMINILVMAIGRRRNFSSFLSCVHSIFCK